jgi:hypothetical protein
VWSITTLAYLERNTTKPFNPLLGETYELVTDKFQYLAEQVGHHPPHFAFHCEGKSGYKIWSNNMSNIKFTGKQVNVIPLFHIYIELLPHNEMYELTIPIVSAHNLLIGTLYLDIGGKSTLRKCGSQEYA